MNQSTTNITETWCECFAGRLYSHDPYEDLSQFMEGKSKNGEGTLKRKSMQCWACVQLSLQES